MTSLTKNSADNPGVNPEGVMDDDSHLKRQLKAGERVLTQVRQEKNSLLDANVRLDVELKDVRAQLADSVKENRRLRHSIYGKLKAGERVLTQVRQEKNSLLDANVRLDVELKDVRAQLADSVKENRRLRHSIYGKCLDEL